MIDNHDPELQEAYERVEATEAEAISVAVRHVAMHTPFVDAPADVDDRGLAEFERIAQTRSITKDELIDLVEKTLTRSVLRLRQRTALYPQLTGVRLSVLAHVALVIGAPALKACQPLWTAISASRWEDAADELMLTKWPERAKGDDDKRRMLELARMMRSGDEPSAWAR